MSTWGSAAGRRAAESYERDWVPAMLQEWATRITVAAEIASGHRVLDVGCGTGVVARECARIVGGTGRVTGLDISADMLSVARRISPDIDWEQGEAGSLPFAESSFDRVLSQFALMFFPDRSMAVTEMWRVLKPGGRLAVVVSGPIEETPAYVALIELVSRYVGDSAADMKSRFVLGDPAEIEGIFTSAGIPDFKIETQWAAEQFGSPAKFVEAELRSSAKLLELFDDASLAVLLRDANREPAFPVTEEGLMEFQSPAHLVTATKK